MAKRTAGTHSTVVRCPNCGEDYSITYKRCPFCDAKAPRRKREHDYDEEPAERSSHKGGKRLVGGGRDPWTPFRVLRRVVALAIIVAAVWIVVTQIMPLITGEKPTPSADPKPSASMAVSPTPANTPAATPTAGPEATSTPTPDPVNQIPSTQTATGFTLSRSDFTLVVGKAGDDSYRLTTSFTPAGSIGYITWSVDKPEVASVSEDGTVRAVGRGTATVTATMAGGVTKTCTVRVNGGSSTSSGESGGETSSAPTEVRLNRTDFSFSSSGESWKMQAIGASGDPVWSIRDTSVATISGDGTVTAVGGGTTTITCTVDGQTLTCIVRCQF